MNKTIIICICLVLGLGGIYLASKGPYTELQEEKTAGFSEFSETDFSSATRIVIGKGKGGQVELEKKDGQWVVASAYGYKADPKVAADIIKSVNAINAGEEVAELRPRRFRLRNDGLARRRRVESAALAPFGFGKIRVVLPLVGVRVEDGDLLLGF